MSSLFANKYVGCVQMDTEACISSLRLRNRSSEAIGAKCGLLTHRVWSLGWLLSGILKPRPNILRVLWSGSRTVGPRCTSVLLSERPLSLHALQLSLIPSLRFFCCFRLSHHPDTVHNVVWSLRNVGMSLTVPYNRPWSGLLCAAVN